MTIPLTIEASEPADLPNSVSVITLESALTSASSFRFNHEEKAKYGRRNSQGPVVKPTRKRSSKDMLVLFDDHDASIGNCNWHNATFSVHGDNDARSEFNAPKPARLQSILSSDASFSSSSSRRSRSRLSPSQDHLLERYVKLVNTAKAQAKKTAPRQPRRKSSSIRMASTCMPLSMPVRKASVHDLNNNFQGRRRDSV